MAYHEKDGLGTVGNIDIFWLITNTDFFVILALSLVIFQILAPIFHTFLTFRALLGAKIQISEFQIS